MTAIQTNGLRRSVHNSVVGTTAVRISRPPIVGVPCFAWCDAGPSSRISWPIWKWRRRRISHGPRMSETQSAVRIAIAVRNVM